ncbi:MAG: hypothetical protein RR548_09220 [Carnobacterium sp.]|uniref:hypothetical protein n=1 Tax=Carnobacterium sp. TaxID=48221 RepID=UPI002FC5D93A
MVNLLILGSLALGLTAWFLPIINLVRHKKNNNKNWVTLSIMSVSACAISLYLQLVYSSHLVEINDLSALMDTIGTIAKAAAILLIVTIVLNGITLVVYRNRIEK